MTVSSAKTSPNDIDRKLLALLRDNARESVTNLAHALSLSRAGVYARIGRLEREGIIGGYTIRIGTDYGRRLIRAHVMLKVGARFARSIERQLASIPELTALFSISGNYDMIAMVEAENVADLNDIIDRIGLLEGVEHTTSSILLATKVER